MCISYKLLSVLMHFSAIFSFWFLTLIVYYHSLYQI